MKRHRIMLALLALVCFFPIFQHLDAWPMQLWDESLFACRALYMAETGQYMFNFNEIEGGIVDMPSSKPPLGTIIQAIFMKIFGYNLFALRLPVAISAFLTLFAMSQFTFKRFNNPQWGYLAVLVLAGCNGYIEPHMVRTADHESFLILFTTLAFFSYFNYIENDLKKKYLWWTILFLFLAFLVKALAAFFFLPAFLIYAILRGKIVKILQQPSTYYIGATLLAAIVLYYTSMNLMNDEYLRRSLLHENFNRFTSTVQHMHKHEFGYNFYLLWNERFKNWIIYIPLSLFLLIAPKKGLYRNFGLLAFLCTITQLLIISFAGTKLSWYDASTFPLLALMVSYFFLQLIEGLSAMIPDVKLWMKWSITTLVLLTFFAIPYFSNVHKVTNFKSEPQQRYKQAFSIIEKKRPDIRSFYVFDWPANYNSLFYSYIYTKYHDFNIKKQHDIRTFNVGDTVVSCNWKDLSYFYSHFTVQRDPVCNGCYIFIIEEQRR